ncbi:DUF418 domain-containing protein [Nocardia sp. NPDC050710]|uniref:DUF418 domain-containing protein n=1 Tax=Nocardia sp. NPDC050710 TaxID=3157220 RepID=UPI0033F5606F
MQPDIPARPRIPELDAVRGFALCGILVVDIWQITGMSATVSPGVMDSTRHMLSVLFEGRFFPIFSFLFGLGFSLFLDSAAEHTDRPRLVLARRLIALGVLGLVHHQFQPGEALLPYAVVGLVILLPAAELSRWILLTLGLAGTVGVALTLGGGLGLVPGLFLLGMAADRFGIAETLRERTWQLAVVFLLAAPAAVVAAWWEYHVPYLDLLASSAPALAGLLGALAYLTGLLLVLRTAFGEVLSEVLQPMGRMALTNYVGATGLILAADPRLGLAGSTNYELLLLLAASIMVVQVIISSVWLRWFGHGPLEWVWRCLTWWQPVPIRPRGAERADSLGLPRRW